MYTGPRTHTHTITHTHMYRQTNAQHNHAHTHTHRKRTQYISAIHRLTVADEDLRKNGYASPCQLVATSLGSAIVAPRKVPRNSRGYARFSEWRFSAQVGVPDIP